MAQSKVKDVSLSDLMECAVCLSQVRDHRALPCQHLFCRTCLEPLVRDGQVPCPVCREPCRLSHKGVSGLPKNPLVVNILESFCAMCKEKPREVFCPHCDQHLCSACSSACQDTVREKMVELRNKSKKLVVRSRQNMAAAVDSLALCQKEAMKACGEIDARAEEIMASIRQQQKTLKDQVQGKANIESDRLRNLTKNIISQVDILQGFISTHDALKEHEQDLSDIWDSCNQWDEYLNKESLTDEMSWIKIQYSKVEDVSVELGAITMSRQVQSLSEQTGCIDVMDSTTGSKQSPDGQRSKQYPDGQRSEQISAEVRCTEASLGLTCTQTVTRRTRPSVDYKSKREPFKVFSKKGSGPGEVSHPTHVAVCAVTGNIVVCDARNNRVNIYNKDTEFVMSFGRRGQNNGEFNFFTRGGIISSNTYGGIAVSPDGTIIVSDTHNHRLQTFTGQGQFIRVIGCHGNKQGQLDEPHDVSCDNSGNIYVVDGNNKRVQVFTLQGEVLRAFDKVQDWNPIDIVVCPNGCSIVTNTRGSIELFNARGQHVRSYKSDVVPGLRCPCCVAVDVEGNILVSDFIQYRLSRIHVLSETGRHVCSWDCADGVRAAGVACTQDGAVVVVDYKGSKIYMY